MTTFNSKELYKSYNEDIDDLSSDFEQSLSDRSGHPLEFFTSYASYDDREIYVTYELSIEVVSWRSKHDFDTENLLVYPTIIIRDLDQDIDFNQLILVIEKYINDVKEDYKQSKLD